MKLILLKKRFLSAVILLLVLSLTLVSCASSDEPKATDSSEPAETTAFIPEDHVFPPKERYQGKLFLSYVFSYDFKQAFEKADLVAHVRILDWKEEGTNIYSTLYYAEVLTLYKGEIVHKGDSDQQIRLIQDGSSKQIIPGYPLFIPGNEFLLFLEECNGSIFGSGYISINNNHTVFDILYSDDGREWISPRLPQADNGIEHLKADCSEEFRQELLENLKEADPIWRELSYDIKNIYELNVIEEYFDSL